MQIKTMIQQRILPIIDLINAHPFITQLSDGSLKNDIYEYYLLQDNLYLFTYGNSLKNVSMMASNKSDKDFFLECATNIDKEVAHLTYGDTHIPWKQSTQACFSYTQFLKANTKGQYALGLSAVFPCFFIYKKVAQMCYPKIKSNPYINWFNTYTSELFVKQTQKIFSILEREYAKCSSTDKAIMVELIEQGSVLEWQFWNDAYHKNTVNPYDARPKRFELPTADA